MADCVWCAHILSIYETHHLHHKFELKQFLEHCIKDTANLLLMHLMINIPNTVNTDNINEQVPDLPVIQVFINMFREYFVCKLSTYS